MTNYTNSTLPEQPGALIYILASSAIVTTTANMFFFILGLKVLKKKAHNMFVISTCGGDCLHGVSLFMLTIINMTGQTLDIDMSGMCLSQIIVYLVSITFSLTIALLICVERYVTVKLKNLGSLTKTEAWKKKLAAILLPFTSGYIIICILAVPKHTDDTGACDLRNLYDYFYHRVVMGLIASLFLCLVLAIIVIYIMLVFNLLKYRAKDRKVAPLTTQCPQNTPGTDPEDRNINSTQNSPENNQTRHTILAMKNYDTSLNGSKNNYYTTSVIGNKDYDTTSVNGNKDYEAPNLNGNDKTGRNDIDDNISCVSLSQVVITTNNCQQPECLPPRIIAFVEESSPKEEETIATSVKPVPLTWKQWELRALSTCVFIIGSTILFMCPTIFAFATEAFGRTVPMSVRGLTAMCVTIRSFVNPLLYVLRFKEIRNALKGICCSKKKGKDRTETVHSTGN